MAGTKSCSFARNNTERDKTHHTDKSQPNKVYLFLNPICMLREFICNKNVGVVAWQILMLLVQTSSLGRRHITKQQAESLGWHSLWGPTYWVHLYWSSKCQPRPYGRAEGQGRWIAVLQNWRETFICMYTYKYRRCSQQHNQFGMKNPMWSCRFLVSFWVVFNLNYCPLLICIWNWFKNGLHSQRQNKMENRKTPCWSWGPSQDWGWGLAPQS